MTSEYEVKATGWIVTGNEQQVQKNLLDCFVAIGFINNYTGLTAVKKKLI